MKRQAPSDWETTAPPQKCARCNANYTFGESRLCRECFDKDQKLCSWCSKPTALYDDEGRCEDCQPVKNSTNNDSLACTGCAYCEPQTRWVREANKLPKITHFIQDGELPDPGAIYTTQVIVFICSKVGRMLPEKISNHERPRWCPIAK